MKRFAMAVTLSLMGASAAMADGRHEWSHESHAVRAPVPHIVSSAPQAWSHGPRSYGPRSGGHPGWRGQAWREQAWRDRGWHDHYAYDRYWRVGERLPTPYYARPYWVTDYRAYRLHEPPAGCHWVRVNGDLVLAAIATGVILEVAHGF